MTSSGHITEGSSSAQFKRQPSMTFDPSDPLFWGPYLSERQWGTPREDYSPDGSCWDYLTYEKATRKAYKWGEDGLLGVSDKNGLLCSSLALWNEQDGILKERLFGLTGKEGNHGEDVKELYYYIENEPSHKYMHALYKYPHNSFPYQALKDHGRSPKEPELDILDTGVFDNNEYWDIHVEYAKPPGDKGLVCRYSVINKSAKSATIHIIPQFYFRNTWTHLPAGRKGKGRKRKVATVLPNFQEMGPSSVEATYDAGDFRISLEHSSNVTFHQLLFTNNDSLVDDRPSGPTSAPSGPTSAVSVSVSKGSNKSAKMSTVSASNEPLHYGKVLPPVSTSASDLASIVEDTPYYSKKNAFHLYIIEGETCAVRDDGQGTKCGAWMSCNLAAGGKAFVYWRLVPSGEPINCSPAVLDQILKVQKNCADDFYQRSIPKGLLVDQIFVCRQALAGLLWSKQFYMYHGGQKNEDMKALHGDSHFLTPQGKRSLGWKHLDCRDVILMPDKWEFPWFAAWDLAIQCAQFASLDVTFAQDQLKALLSDRFMHPNGQIPGCEFDFGDPNPPNVAWAVWKIHQHEKAWHMDFLKSCYPRLIISYQWWHKLDPTSSHLYGKGFLGLDNISVFDRSNPPGGIKTIKQADATGWMGLFALTMLQISLELCKHDVCLTDMAIRFLNDFLAIAKAMNADTGNGGLWSEEDGFYYDVAHMSAKARAPIQVRSMSGIVPLLACARVSLKHSPMVKRHLLTCDADLAPYVSKLVNDEFFFSLVPYVKLKAVLRRVFSEDEFLSPFGIRSLSKAYQDNPYTFEVKGESYSMTYQPGESDSDMFGGNSNWRGPVWLCMNYLLVECIETYSELNQIFTQPLSMVYPTGRADSKRVPLQDIACDLCQRVVNLYTPDPNGGRPAHGHEDKYLEDDWSGLVQFYEYFHGDTGRGCGASHQTGWSALYVEFVRKLSGFKKRKTSS